MDMQFKLVSLLMFALFVVVFSSISTGFYNDPKYPGKCAISDQIILSPGEEYQESGSCSLMKCVSAGFVLFTGCFIEAPPSNCKFIGYKHPLAAFPDCCDKKYECSVFKEE